MGKDDNGFGLACPICYKEWTKTPRIVCNDYWYHCEKCEKKADVLMKEAAEAKEKAPDKYKYSRSVDWGYKDMYLGVPSEFTTKPAKYRDAVGDSVSKEEMDKLLKKGQDLLEQGAKEQQLSLDELLEQAAADDWDWDDVF